MVPIEAKNLKLPVLQDHKFREFEAILYYVRGFEALAALARMAPLKICNICIGRSTIFFRF